MGTNLKLHELTGSPNSVKVRVALGYKGLEYERVALELEGFPGDRSSIVALSRQPRLPVLQHGDTVIFDSGAILRYLEANFPETARIFRDDYEEHAQIEQWETFGRTQLGEPVRMMFGQALAPQAEASVVAQAAGLLHERTGPLEDKLSTGDVLVGDEITAADISCASALYLADMTEQVARSNPIGGFFHQHFKLGDGRDRTRAWARRVLVHDPVMGRR